MKRYLFTLSVFIFGIFFFIPAVVESNVCAQTTSSSTANPATGGPSFLQCSFHRNDMATPDEQFKSPTLMSYFAEASLKSGVPATLLAGIARVESPSSVSMTDETLSSFSCPTSPTGAKGLMQIQPPGTTGHDPAAINAGAKFLNKTVNDISPAEYCDLRTSVFLASGFVLKKLQYAGYGNGETWDPAWTNNKDVINAVARGYYGCLRYPSCASGPHSYGDDLWTSMQNCQNADLNFSVNRSIGPNQSMTVRSNRVCTKVGDPTTGNPCGDEGPVVPPGNFVHYCQNDPRWAQTCGLSAAGCGPSSMAMILSTFGVTCNGAQCTPPETDKLFHSSGARSCSGGAGSVIPNALNSSWLKGMGVTVGPGLTTGGSLDYELAKRFINEGSLILGSTRNAPSCNCDHIFVVQDVDPANRTVVVRDPVCGLANGAAFEKQYNYNNITWLYAYPIKGPQGSNDAI